MASSTRSFSRKYTKYTNERCQASKDDIMIDKCFKQYLHLQVKGQLRCLLDMASIGWGDSFSPDSDLFEMARFLKDRAPDCCVNRVNVHFVNSWKRFCHVVNPHNSLMWTAYVALRVALCHLWIHPNK